MAMKQWILLLNALLILTPMSSCGSKGNQSTGTTMTTTSSGPQAMFPYVQGWLGADGAYSVSLGSGRSLWFFDDTFIGPSSAISRTQSTGFIHNSVGISNCTGMNCSFQYFWNGMNTSAPGPIFVAPGSDWYWAMDNFIYNGTLYVALMQMHAAGSGAFGFAYSGSVLASISHYTAPPSQWNITYQQLNTGGTVVPGVSIVVDEGPGGNPNQADPNGARYAYFFAGVGSPPYLALLRVPLTDLNHLARPGNTDWQYLNTSGTWESWLDSATTLPSDNAPVINPGATEMTVRWHSSANQWIAVYPGGLTPQAWYALSPSLTSGWGASEALYTYPEMQASNANYTPNVFCYAAKEHPEFETAGQLMFTYVCNSTVESDVTNNMNLYHPIVVTRSLPQK